MKTAPQSKPSITRAVGSTLKLVGQRFMLERHVRFWGKKAGVAAGFELSGTVLSSVAETTDTRTLVIQPDERWKGHKAGQYTTLSAEFDGVTNRRCYSISSGTDDPTITLTVRRVPEGKVSNYVHDELKPGDIVELEQAAGEFVLPDTTPDKILFIAGGSGITPILAMVRELARRQKPVDAYLLYYARSRDEMVGLEALELLQQRLNGFTFLPRFDNDSTREPGFVPAEVQHIVSDFAVRETFVCGPPGLMKTVYSMWAEEADLEKLHTEAFVLEHSVDTTSDTVEVTALRRDHTVEGGAGQSLLASLEASGMRPKHGCRMGICRTCRCRKVSGTTKDMLTGELDSREDVDVALCISTPVTKVTLDI